jgi:hypothetical protein
MNYGRQSVRKLPREELERKYRCKRCNYEVERRHLGYHLYKIHQLVVPWDQSEAYFTEAATDRQQTLQSEKIS